MKKEIGAKLLAYSGFAAAYLSVSTTQAQVYYTDFVPDEVVGTFGPQNEIFIDLNEDGSDDVRIFAMEMISSFGGYSAILAEGINPAGVNGCFMATSYLSSINDYGGAAQFNDGDLVDNDASFGSGTATLFRQNFGATSNSTGLWAPGDSAALGMRLDIAGKSYFGWIKVELTAPGQVTILDYMLNAEPNTALAINEPPPPPCTTPTGLMATLIPPNQVRLEWDPVPNAEKYQLRGRVPGSLFATKITNSNSIVVGVSSGKNYEWMVRARCFGGESTGFSSVHTFTTPAPRAEKPRYVTLSGAAAVSDLIVYTEFDKLSINSLGEEVSTMRLFDLTGELVIEHASAFSFKDFSLEALPTGMYILHLNRKNDQVSHKLLIE